MDNRDLLRAAYDERVLSLVGAIVLLAAALIFVLT